MEKTLQSELQIYITFVLLSDKPNERDELNWDSLKKTITTDFPLLFVE